MLSARSSPTRSSTTGAGNSDEQLQELSMAISGDMSIETGAVSDCRSRDGEFFGVDAAVDDGDCSVSDGVF